MFTKHMNHTKNTKLNPPYFRAFRGQNITSTQYFNGGTNVPNQ